MAKQRTSVVGLIIVAIVIIAGVFGVMAIVAQTNAKVADTADGSFK